MPITVNVLSRQRKVRIDTWRFQSMLVRLAQATVENLIQLRPKHLSAQQLRAMGESGTLSVVLVSNSTIRKLNKLWRHEDKATDVLSFPLTLNQAGEDLPFELGEIVISIEKAQKQAIELGHSFKREMAFLFVHGFLHILGFDHVTKRQEKEMFSRQSRILDTAGYIR